MTEESRGASPPPRFLELTTSVVDGVLEALRPLLDPKHSDKPWLLVEARRKAQLSVSNILHRAGIQETPLPTDSSFMTDVSPSPEPTDGPLDVPERPVKADDVEILRRLGAPDWMVQKAHDLAHNAAPAACGTT